MDDVKIRELTAKAKLQTDTKHAPEVKKFQADLEGVFSEEVREALALTYSWTSTSPIASFEIDGKVATISPAPYRQQSGSWIASVQGLNGASVAFKFNLEVDFLLLLDANREAIRRI